MRRSSIASPEACTPDGSGSCSLCADEGLIAQVVEVLPQELSARVEVEGMLTEVALDLLDDVQPGDRVVVHLGFAIAQVRDD